MLRAESTIRSAASILQNFLSCAYDKHYIDKRLLPEFVIPRAQEADIYNPDALNLNDVFAIIDDVWDTSKRPEIAAWSKSILDFYPMRLKTLILVQMTTALRLGETCNRYRVVTPTA